MWKDTGIRYARTRRELSILERRPAFNVLAKSRLVGLGQLGVLDNVDAAEIGAAVASDWVAERLSTTRPSARAHCLLSLLENGPLHKTSLSPEKWTGRAQGAIQQNASRVS